MAEKNAADSPRQSLLSIFPQSVWQRILNKYDNSKDTEKVLHALPELSAIFQEMKSVWYFDQVFPHMYKNGDCYGKKQLLKFCQRVCRRWTSVTQNFQRNHPSVRAYNPAGATRRSVPYGEFSYDEVSPVITGCFHFGSILKLLDFQQAMRRHRRDPFQSRHVVILNNDIRNVDAFVDSTFVFCQMFGKHVKTISLMPQCGQPSAVSSRRLFNKLLGCLAHLPNAHHLFLDFDLDLGSLSEQDLAAVLPETFNFETIGFGLGVPLKIQRIILNKFAPVKKLITPQGFSTECLRLMDSLVELSTSSTAKDFCRIARLTQLRKLSLKKVPTEIRSPEITCLFDLLRAVPLEELDVQLFPFQDKGYSAKKIPQFPSLKYLRITDHPNHTFNFLKAFPSLKQLEVDWFMTAFGAKVRQRSSMYRVTGKEQNAFTTILRYYLYETNVPESVSIWPQLPSLELLTVVGNGPLHFKVKFARECGNKPFYSFIIIRDDE